MAIFRVTLNREVKNDEEAVIYVEAGSDGEAIAKSEDIGADHKAEWTIVDSDDGESWADAILEPSLNPPFTWVRWAYAFDAQPGKYTMKLRATDGNGTVMDETERDPLPNGATGWPRRRFEVKD